MRSSVAALVQGSALSPTSHTQLARLRARRAQPVTVVVPVYNAARELARCLRSLEAHTAPNVRLLIINDHSPDYRAPLTAHELADRRPNVTVQHNPRNLGYVATVNRAMQQCEGDVVLLNSDTEVTRGWIPALQRAAAAHEGVATVSPLSNAAGVFSLPRAKHDNPLPRGVTPSAAANVLGSVSPRLREVVPVTCGFCMYITREAMDAIGYFDEYLFHRGYGEENDYCVRATEAGMLNVIDDATFVYHAHGASFGGSRAALKRRNAAVLRALHPHHVRDSLAWEEASRLQAVREAFAVHANDAAHWKYSRTRLVLDDAAPGRWDAAERVIAVKTGPQSLTIDLFGLAQQRHDVADTQESRLGVLFGVIDRWNVDVVDLPSPSSPNHALGVALQALVPCSP